MRIVVDRGVPAGGAIFFGGGLIGASSAITYTIPFAEHMRRTISDTLPGLALIAMLATVEVCGSRRGARTGQGPERNAYPPTPR